MKPFLNFFSKAKNPLISNQPQDPDYLTLVNYLNSNAHNTSKEDAIEFINHLKKTNTIDNITRQRLLAFYWLFKNDLGASYEAAYQLATTEPYDQDMVGLVCSILSESGKFQDAYAFIKHYAIEDKINNKQQYYNSRGSIAWYTGHTEEAIHYFNLTLTISPTDPSSLHQLRAIYTETGDKEKARDCHRILKQEYPDGYDLLFFESMYQIEEGMLFEGWKSYELRYHSSLASKYYRADTLGRKRWDGSPSKNNEVLFLFFEQGLGDTLMTSRYLDQLSQKFPKIYADCQPEARDLLQQNFRKINFSCTPRNAPLPFRYDYWIGSMSLPYLLGTENKNIYAPRSKYLRVTNTNFSSPFSNHPREEPLIGISWSGNPAHQNDARRSLDWDIVKSIISKSNFRFYSIQTYVPSDPPSNLINISDHLITLTDTAELVEKLDLIITVDTSLVHLAGALGKQTWLLCAFHPEWRWGKEEGETTLYDSVKLYKQLSFNSPEEILTRVILEELPKYFENRDDKLVY